jgi:serine/threonine protein phosphatase 1
MENRAIAISDIHGCLLTFKYLLEEKVQFTKEDTLYLLGDYIDRGPDSKGVVDYILKLQEDGFQVHCLRGNHEQMLLDALESKAKADRFLMYGGKQTMESYNCTLEDFQNHPHLNFYKNLRYYIELDKYYLVHAGFDFRGEGAFYRVKPMIWIRDWYYDIDKSQLNGKIIVHGHTPQRKPAIEEMLKKMQETQVIDIDAGCFKYKKMCAFDLTNQKLFFQDCLDEVNW